MNASIRSQPLHGAYVQENGIIRMADGRFLGRLDGIEFEEVVERSRVTAKPDGERITPEQVQETGERLKTYDWQMVEPKFLLALAAQMKADEQERERLRSALWSIRTEGFDPNCHYCQKAQALVEKTLLGGPPIPPPQLEWVETIEENVPVYRTQHGKYSLEVVNGRSAVSWWINAGRKVVAANGGMPHVETAMEEAEQALQGLLEAEKPTPPPASTAPPGGQEQDPT